MRRTAVSRKAFAALGVAVGVAVGFVAHAMMGTPGGATRNVLTFAGTLTDAMSGMPVMGQQTLEFSFTNGGGVPCTPAVLMATPDSKTGAFTVDIPLDKCGAGYFDGSDVTYSIHVGQTLVTDLNNPPTISPVPYAKYADVAANLTPQSAPAQAIAALQSARPAFKSNGKLQQYLDATFVGVTATQYDGDLIDNPALKGAGNGYAAAAKACQLEFTPTSHMCTGEELERYFTADGSVPRAAWYSTFADVGYPDTMGTGLSRDCQGWTSYTGLPSGFGGPVVTPANGPNSDGCNVSHGIACCD